MRNPLRSEAEAFRFLIVVIAGAAIIAVAAYIDRWVGVGAAVLVVGGVTWWFVKAPSGEAAAPRLVSGTPAGMRRILVVANETVGGQELLAEVRGRAGDRPSRILVVCPALNSPIRHWASDEDQARAAAQARLDASLGAMRAGGLQVEGEIGDGDPIQAIEDAVRTFQPDELIISTHPEGRSHWLERGVVEKARERFAVPITHVVVDLERS
jgi:GABA permease